MSTAKIIHILCNEVIIFLFLIVNTKNVEAQQNSQMLIKTNYTSGSFQVNESGASVYDIPLTVSPGTAGMKPKISLTYSSQGSYGFLGTGWSLSGLSVISRSSATIADDGVSKGISFNGEDKLCIDGQRLVVTSGNYGKNGSIYSTEQRDFSKIISYGISGDFPQRFKVWTKAGLIYEYGGTKNSQILASGKSSILCWAVNKIEDTKGNYILIDYEENINTGEYLPSKIEYTGNKNAGLTPYASIRFYYQNRNSIISNYISGSVIKTTKILTSIKSLYSNKVVREYKFDYLQNSTNSYFLKKITECVENQCLLPIEFEWAPTYATTFNPGIYNYPGGWDFGMSYKDPETGQTIHRSDWDSKTGDFNGDGNIDFIRIGSKKLHYFFSNGDGTFSTGEYFYPTPWEFGQPSDWETQIGDFNGDGKTDFLRIGGIKLHYFFSNGDGSFSTGEYPYPKPWDFGMSYKDHETEQIIHHSDWETITGDFNTDGKSDFIRIGSKKLHYFFSNGDGTFSTGEYFYPTPWEFGQPSDWETQIGDFNGDGKTDFLRIGGIKLHYFFSNGDGSFSTGEYRYPKPWDFGMSYKDHETEQIIHHSDWDSKVGDFNGDGKSDLVRLGATYLHYFLSKGDGTFDADSTHFPGDWNFGQPSPWEALLDDINGDGKTDLIRLGPKYLHYFHSRGDGTFFTGKYGYPSDWDFGQPSDWETLTGDFNGDGKMDFLRIGAIKLHYFYSDAYNTLPNLITQIRTGNRAKITITYQPLTNKNVYQKYNTAKYPEVNFQGPVYVVQNYKQSNGIGGNDLISYKYEGAVINLHGRGFRGFNKIIINNNQSKISSTIDYEINYKFAGSGIKKIVNRTSTGKKIYEVKNVLKYVDYKDGTKFSYIRRTTEKNYDLRGDLLNQSIITKDCDFHGNIKNMSVEVGGLKTVTVNTYYPQTFFRGRYFLDRLSSSSVTKIKLNEISDEKTSNFSYDSVTGILNKEVFEPSTPFQLEKSYKYDVFGNIIESNTSGKISEHQIQTRTKTSRYDTKGRFLIEFKNEEGMIEFRDNEPLLGNLKKLTGPNHLITIWEYDKFGRQILETRADGSTTKRTVVLSDKMGKGVHAFYQETINNSSTSPSTIYYDMLNREVMKLYKTFEGKTVADETHYDKMGRMILKVGPYLIGSSYKSRIRNSITYDLMGRFIKQTLPGNIVTTTRYSGLKTITTNGLSQKTTIIKNGIGQVVASIDNQSNQLKYKYDLSGNLLEVYNNNIKWFSFKFNKIGQKIESVDANGDTTKFDYNAFGDLIESNSNGEIKRFGYDKLGRLVKRIEREGESNFIYDSAQNGIGKLIMVTGFGCIINYVYDSLGRLVEKRQKNNDQNYDYTLRYQYDKFGRINKTKYPSGYEINNVFDSNGILCEVRGTNDKSLWKLQKLNILSEVEEQYLGNEVSIKKTYDLNTGNLKNITSENKLDTIENLSFKYDKGDNLIFRSNNLKNVSETFTYDELNRLIKSSVLKDSVNFPVDITYNALGNIINKTDVGHYNYEEGEKSPYSVTSITKDSVIINKLFYDERGNQTISEHENIEYTSFNLPFSIKKGEIEIKYTYNPNRERLTKAVFKNGVLQTIKKYVDGLYEEEEQKGNVEKVHYLNALDGLFAVYSNKGDTNFTYIFLHRDHLGSLSTLTNENGSVLDKFSFDAWGKRRNANDWVGANDSQNKFPITIGFSGHEQLDEVGLIHMNGRIYDPEICKFLEVDPLVQNSNNLQSFNSYSYVMNNPATLIDPTGAFSVKNAFNNFVSGAWTFLKYAHPMATQWNAAYQINPELTMAGTAIAGAIYTGGAANVGYAIMYGAGIGFGTAFLGTVAGGGSGTDALGAGAKAGVIGGITAGLTYGVGEIPYWWAKVPLHGAIQGGSTAAQGGKFEHGFYAGALTNSADFAIDDIEVGNASATMTAQVMAAAVVGGTAEAIGGGKFANGAISGAFVRLYNSSSHPKNQDGDIGDQPYTSADFNSCTSNNYELQGTQVNYWQRPDVICDLYFPEKDKSLVIETRDNGKLSGRGEKASNLSKLIMPIICNPFYKIIPTNPAYSRTYKIRILPLN